MAAPTLANIDADADLEIVLNTAHSGVVAYDLPGSANASILWGTGRGNFQRSGSFLIGELSASTISPTMIMPAGGDTLSYEIVLKNSGPALESVSVNNPLPPQVTYAGGLTASEGTPGYSGGTVSWTGDVTAGQPVQIVYDVTVNSGVTTPTIIINSAVLEDGEGNEITLSSRIMANGLPVYFPLIFGQD
jgi:uncharacterized repeat protein (TIGR01451 family)